MIARDFFLILQNISNPCTFVFIFTKCGEILSTYNDIMMCIVVLSTLSFYNKPVGTYKYYSTYLRRIFHFTGEMMM